MPFLDSYKWGLFLWNAGWSVHVCSYSPIGSYAQQWKVICSKNFGGYFSIFIWKCSDEYQVLDISLSNVCAVRQEGIQQECSGINTKLRSDLEHLFNEGYGSGWFGEEKVQRGFHQSMKTSQGQVPRGCAKLCSEMHSDRQEVMAMNRPSTTNSASASFSWRVQSPGTAAQGGPGVSLWIIPNPPGCAPVCPGDPTLARGGQRSPELPPNPKGSMILWVKPLQLWKFIAGVRTRPSCSLQHLTDSQCKATL